MTALHTRQVLTAILEHRGTKLAVTVVVVAGKSWTVTVYACLLLHLWPSALRQRRQPKQRTRLVEAADARGIVR